VEERPELLDLRLGEFFAELGAEVPAPGGGSAAAAAVAMAAGLVRSVASLSREGWSEAGGVIAQAETVARRVDPLIGEVARAYEDALRTMAERTPIAAAERDARLAESLERAAAAPLEIAEAAADAAELAALTTERCQPGFRPDAFAAAALADAAAGIAATLVEINLGLRRDDSRRESVTALAARATAGRQRALKALAG
jgi:formiminotetrahydrofolate cyclodeaminase